MFSINLKRLANVVHRKSSPYKYWPPRDKSTVESLPGGRKKMFVFNGKCDRDGSEKPVLCISSVGNERLAFFDTEELAELSRISHRLLEYMVLWEKKAIENKNRADEIERKQLAAEDSIGVDI